MKRTFNPLSYDNRFDPEPMKRYPRSRLVASLAAPPRQKAQVERMVSSPHTFRVVVLEDNKTLCVDRYRRREEHIEVLRSLAKPGVITLVTDLRNNNVKAEGVLHLYSAFSFVHRLGDFLVNKIGDMFGGRRLGTTLWDVFSERASDSYIARGITDETVRAYTLLTEALAASGIRNLTKNDWQLRPGSPFSGEYKLRRFIVTHTNSDMHRKRKVKPAFWEQSVADWVALSEMPSARARKGRGEPWLLIPPLPGEYDEEDEEILTKWAEAINTFFPPFAQAVLTNLEGSVIDITVCDS